MGSIILRKYGVQATVGFGLYKLDGTGLKTDAVSASGDVTLNRDEGGEETLDDDQFTDRGRNYSLLLSVAEMTAARIIVNIVDQSSPQVWLDKQLIIETYGNASAQHAFDLATATQNVNVASIDNIDFGATMKTSLETAVDNGLDNAIGGAPTAGSVAERVKTLDDNFTATRAGYLDELAAANLPTDVAAVKTDTGNIVTDTNEIQGKLPTNKIMGSSDVDNHDTDIDSILADTNELQTDWHDGGRLDVLIDLIKTDTADVSPILADTNELQTDWHDGGRLDLIIDALALEATVAALNDISADNVWDEVMDVGAPANANTARKIVNILAAVIAGKSSGGGTNTNVYRDTGDTKNRVSATVDADGNRTAVGTLDGT